MSLSQRLATFFLVLSLFHQQRQHAASRLLFFLANSAHSSCALRPRRLSCSSSWSSSSSSSLFVLCSFVFLSLVGWWYSFLRRPKLRKFFYHVVDLHVSHSAVLAVGIAIAIIVGYVVVVAVVLVFLFFATPVIVELTICCLFINLLFRFLVANKQLNFPKRFVLSTFNIYSYWACFSIPFHVLCAFHGFPSVFRSAPF